MYEYIVYVHLIEVNFIDFNINIGSRRFQTLLGKPQKSSDPLSGGEGRPANKKIFFWNIIFT